MQRIYAMGREKAEEMLSEIRAFVEASQTQAVINAND